MVRVIQLAGACVVLLAAAAGQLQAATIVGFGNNIANGNKYVHTISGLDIGLDTYDVTFHEGSFENVYGPLSTMPSSYPWTTSTEAYYAAAAIADFLFAEFTADGSYGFTGLDFAEPLVGLSQVRIPWYTPSSSPFSPFEVFTVSDLHAYAGGPVDSTAYMGYDSSVVMGSNPLIHWAVFEVSRGVVPEPASITLWSLGMLGLTGMRIRRKQG